MNSSEFTFFWVLIKVVCSVLAIHPALNLNIPEFIICPISVFPFLQVMLIGSGFLVENIHAFNDGICRGSPDMPVIMSSIPPQIIVAWPRVLVIILLYNEKVILENLLTCYEGCYLLLTFLLIREERERQPPYPLP